jgi:hypothetical protein
LLQITFLSPETITHKIAIFQTQQTAPLLPLPEINFNLPRKICMTRDQPRPGSFPISFPEHARSQVKGGHSSGEIELIQACDWLTTDSTLDFQREFYACLAIVAKYK